MKTNVFEGARRIAVLLAAVAVVGTIIATFGRDPYVSGVYEVVVPAVPPKLTKNDCPSEYGRQFFTAKTSQGKSVSITLCMLTMQFDNGAKLVPYRVDDKGALWGNDKYSQDVAAYGRRLEESFQLPAADEKLISEKISDAFWVDVRENAKYLAIGLAIYWLAIWTVGWIVRGFFGIPQGADRKPD